jgi:hypothetical protein
MKAPRIEDTFNANLRLKLKEKEKRDPDPYQGVASKTATRKRDLRALSEWIEAKRRAEEAKRERGGED